MEIELLYPLGFCKGVQKAIDTAIEAANTYNDLPIYCIGPIVHNKIVNDFLISKNIHILNGNKKDLIDSIDKGVVIFSAHGTDTSLIDYAKSKNLIVINTICTYVQKSMDIIKQYLNNEYKILFIGVNNHPENEAICSISQNVYFCTNKENIPTFNKTDKILVANQTTLSIDDLTSIHNLIKAKYPQAIFADEICNSTRLRQQQIKNVDSKIVDGIIIVGDKTSNNTKSLFKLALNKNIDTIMIENLSDLNYDWLLNKKHICIASGASTPLKVIKEVHDFIRKL